MICNLHKKISQPNNKSRLAHFYEHICSENFLEHVIWVFVYVEFYFYFLLCGKCFFKSTWCPSTVGHFRS